MAYFPSTEIIDSQTGSAANVSAYGSLQTADLVRLIGGTFEGATLSSVRWDSVLLNGGTVPQSGGVVTVSTNTTADGAASFYSDHVARFLAGSPNRFATHLRLTDTGVANNVRRWGAFDASNGLFFELNGTAFRVVSRKAGVDTAVPSGSFNGAQPIIDTNNHRWTIMYEPSGARFYQSDADGNEVLLHHMTFATSLGVGTMHLKIGHQSVNSSGATTNAGFEVRGTSISRFGAVVAHANRHYTATAETVTLKSSPGNLREVVIGRKGSGGATITLYDATTADAAKIIDVIDVVNFQGAIPYDLDFHTGLTYTTSSGIANAALIFD